MQSSEIKALLQQVSHHNKNEKEEQLRAAVNHLIVADFEKLVQLLYAVDVDEKRLKTLLQQRPDVDAAQIITSLLVERQLQKAALRQRFNTDATNDDNEESW